MDRVQRMFWNVCNACKTHFVRNPLLLTMKFMDSEVEMFRCDKVWTPFQRRYMYPPNTIGVNVSIGYLCRKDNKGTHAGNTDIKWAMSTYFTNLMYSMPTFQQFQSWRQWPGEPLPQRTQSRESTRAFH